VEDLRSANGVQVNGDRVQAAPLIPGCRLTLGNVQLVFQQPVPEIGVSERIALLGKSELLTNLSTDAKQAMAADIDRLAEEVAATMNAAKDGHIIADTEELVRDANAVFREQMYARAISLLQSKQEAFSPSAPRVQEQGSPATTCNGRHSCPSRGAV
jgi:pSer/pThr/pTyr-binding forkhead associated (FHA) protein